MTNIYLLKMLCSYLAIQYTDEQNIGEHNYIMGGNDYDCGALLPLALYLIREHHNNKDMAKLTDQQNVRNNTKITMLSNMEGLLKKYNLIPSSLTPVYKGASGCHIAVIDGKKYYIKPFSYGSNKDGSNQMAPCNPKEAFLYKVLEKINFGPKTTFLLSNTSSSQGSKRKGNKNYSPRERLSESCINHAYDYKGNLSDVSSVSKYIKFAVAKDVRKKLFEELKIEEAIAETKDDISILIDDYQDVFVENAKDKLKALTEKIARNIKNYKETDYYNHKGIAHTQ